MAIDPKLLVIKPVDELAEVTGLQAGSMLFYDGSDNLKRISIDTFNNLSKTAKPLAPTDPTPSAEGLYKPTISGTYTNAGGLVAQVGYDTLFFFNGTTWTKSEVLLPGVRLSPEFDKSTETEAQGGKQIAERYDYILESSIYKDAPKTEFQKYASIAVKEILIKELNPLYDYYLTGIGRNYDNSVNGYLDNQYFVRIAIVEKADPSNFRYSTAEIYSDIFLAVPAVLENDDFAVAVDWTLFPEFQRMAVDFTSEYLIHDNKMHPIITSYLLRLIRSGTRNIYLLGAGNGIDTGELNLIIGEEAAQDFVDAGGNVGVGFRVFRKKQGGGGNTAVGNSALEESEQTIDCTAVGSSALSKTKGGVGDTAVGRKAIEVSQWSGANTGVGDSSLMSVNYNPDVSVNPTQKGWGNSALGYGAGVDGTDWCESVLTGLTAGRKGIGGRRNVINGALALYNRLLGTEHNTINGWSAMYNSMSGNWNTVTGASAMYDASGDYNIVSGFNSGVGMATMNRSIIMGCFAGSSVSATYNVVVIGHGSMASKNNQIVLGNSEHQEIVILGVPFTKDDIQALKDSI